MNVAGWFVEGWSAPLRVVVVGTSAYLALIILMRISGNRTLSKMNAFDFVVTVAIGSTLASALLSEGVALVEGITALALLVVLQWVITWLSARSPFVTRVVKSEPVLLVRAGQMLPGAMRAARVNESDILQAVRGQGLASVEDVAALVLETDGSFSVIPTSSGTGRSALANVDQSPEARHD